MTKRLAAVAASTTPSPVARYAASAAESVQPVPWTLRVATHGARNQVSSPSRHSTSAAVRALAVPAFHEGGPGAEAAQPPRRLRHRLLVPDPPAEQHLGLGEIRRHDVAWGRSRR